MTVTVTAPPARLAGLVPVWCGRVPARRPSGSRRRVRREGQAGVVRRGRRDGPAGAPGAVHPVEDRLPGRRPHGPAVPPRTPDPWSRPHPDGGHPARSRRPALGRTSRSVRTPGPVQTSGPAMTPCPAPRVRAGRAPKVTTARDGGSATVAAVGVIAVLLLLTGSALTLSSAVLASHRARSAADLASLAGASALMRGEPPGAACARAAAVARRGDAQLLSLSRRRAQTADGPCRRPALVGHPRPPRAGRRLSAGGAASRALRLSAR